jgi:hypothetical protein
VTAKDTGQANLSVPDSAVLALAIVQERTVLTFNRRDFIYLHRKVSPHHGIIVCTRDDNVSGMALRIHQTIMSCPSLRSELLRVNRPQNP